MPKDDAPEVSQVPVAFNFQNFPAIIFARSKRAKRNLTQSRINESTSLPLTGKERNIVVLVRTVADATILMSALKECELFDDIVLEPSYRFQNLAQFLFRRPQYFCDITGMKARELKDLCALERLSNT